MAMFYLVRHGQTEWNKAGRMQGRGDSHLTSLGQEQAGISSEELKDVPLTHCYHSPMIRTEETANILLRNHPDIVKQKNEDFLEIGFGIWEGSYNRRAEHEQIRSKEETQLHNFWFNCDNFTGAPEDGEDFYQLQDRMYAGVEKLMNRHADSDTVLIVSHCAAIRAFLNKCIGRPVKDFWELPKTAPASISIVRWEKGQKPEVLLYSGHPVPEVSSTI